MNASSNKGLSQGKSSQFQVEYEKAKDKNNFFKVRRQNDRLQEEYKKAIRALDELNSSADKGGSIGKLGHANLQPYLASIGESFIKDKTSSSYGPRSQTKDADTRRAARQQMISKGQQALLNVSSKSSLGMASVEDLPDAVDILLGSNGHHLTSGDLIISPTKDSVTKV